MLLSLLALVLFLLYSFNMSDNKKQPLCTVSRYSFFDLLTYKESMHLLTQENRIALFKQYLPKPLVIVEAGAFKGNDTKQLASAWPDAMVHCFEPVPTIFALLAQNTAQVHNIKRYEYALSDKTGTAQFHLAEKISKPGKPFQAGSLLAPKERLHWSSVVYKERITVPTITVPDWMDTFHIPTIDFLWLDLQGHEYAVLQAALPVLPRIQLLYLEVHFIQAYETQPMYREVVHWLEQQGFALVGTDFTNETDWFFGNALFYNTRIPS
jgi:FkbM family methyltransferase